MMELHYFQKYLKFLTTIIALLLFLYSLIKWKKKGNNNPPKPSGSWPFIGHLPLIGNYPHIKLGKLADIYGPIFMLNLGVKQALVVSSSNIAKECLLINDKVFVNRPHTLFVEHVAYNSAMFGFSPLGEYWRMMRKIINAEILSNKRVESQKKVRIFEIKSAIKKLFVNGSKEIDMQQWFYDLVINITVRLISGKSFNEYFEGEEYKRYSKAFREFFELANGFAPENVIPYLKWFDFRGYKRKLKLVAKEIDFVAQTWLDEHQRNKVCGKLGEFEDFMDALLGNFEQGKGRNTLPFEPDTIIKANCMFIILAGTDTTSTTLTWALSLLLNNKESMNKIQAELDTVVGKQRLVQESDLKNLVYLELVLKETLRLYPPGPLSVPRESISDCTINGYNIPSGTQLLINLYKLHRDPKVWENPSKFIPERFTKGSKEYDFRGGNFEYLPFGSGKRMCPGICLGLQMMRITLANLLHVFDISIASGESVDMTEGFGLSNPKATSLEVILTPRLPREVYNEFYY